MSNTTIPATPTGLNMFTMQSVSAYTVLTKFKLELKAVSCPNGNGGSNQKVDESFFLLSQPQGHR